MFNLTDYFPRRKGSVPSRVRRLKNRHRRGRLDLGVEQLEDRSLLALSDLLYENAFRLGSPGFDLGKAMAVDTAGDYYIAGGMEGTIDFDPGPAVANKSGDIFAAKYSSSGALLWAKALSGDFAYEGGDVTVDTSGNVYVTSSFQGTVDFNPGSGTFSLSSPSYRSPFVLKLDPSGNFLWARNFAVTTDADATGIAVDTAGNVYAAGYFGDSFGGGSGGTIDFIPGAGGSRTNAGQRDVFVVSLDSSGNYRWDAIAGGAEDDLGRGVGTDALGNVYVAGEFMGTVDFDPGPGTFNVDSAGFQDAFIWKFSSSGVLLGAKAYGAGATESVQGFSVDDAGQSYLIGYFYGDTMFPEDFDPGPDVCLMLGHGNRDVFVAKLNSDLSLAWGNSLGGSGEDGTTWETGQPTARLDVASGLGHSVFAVGSFKSSDFSAGPTAPLLNSAGFNDVFVLRLNSDTGDYVWAGQLGGTSNDGGSGVAVDNLGNVYVTGWFAGTADFDPSLNVHNLTSAGQTDAFVSVLTVDLGLPHVTIEQSASQTDPTNDSTINFTAVFSEPVTGFATGDVTLGGTAPGTLIGTVTPEGLDGTTYNIAVTGMTGSGIVIASVAAGTAFDLDSHGNTASTSSDNLVLYDVGRPTGVLSNPANGSSIPFSVLNFLDYLEVTYADVEGSGLNPASIIDALPEFTLAGEGAAGVTVHDVPQLVGGSTYRYPFSGDFVSGPVTVQWLADSYADMVGNMNLASTEGFTVIDAILVGPGVYYDADGDKYTVKFKGPGTCQLSLLDPDGDGKGPISSIQLEGTTIASTLSVSVSKAKTGDGKVSIGQITSVAGATGDGSLKSLSASKSNVIGTATALNFAGGVGTITLGGILGGGDVLLGGSPDKTTKMTVSGMVAADEIRSGRAVSSFKAVSVDAASFVAPSVGSISTTAGRLDTDLDVAGAVSKISTKKGGASGDWTAASFGTITISGGGFAGQVISTASAATLGKKAAISKFSTTGDFAGTLHALGKLTSFSAGGSVADSTIAASPIGTFKVTGNLGRSVVLSGANLGADHKLEGLGADADTFGGGTIKSFSVGGAVTETMVGSGLDPNGMVFRNGNDLIVGGEASKVSSFKIVGAAGTENYFRAGKWPKSVKIAGVSVNPLADARFLDLQNFADAGTTDENGLVTLHLPLGDMTYEFVDKQSGYGIPGLLVGVSTGTGTPGLAVLEAFDPAEQYTTMMIMLRGPDAGLTLASASASDMESVPVTLAAAGLTQKIYASATAAGMQVSDGNLSPQLPPLPENFAQDAVKAGVGVLEAAIHLPGTMDQLITGGWVKHKITNFVETPIVVTSGQAATQELQANGNVTQVILGGLGTPVQETDDLAVLTSPTMSAKRDELLPWINQGAQIYAAAGHAIKAGVGNVAFVFGLYNPPTPTQGFSVVSARPEPGAPSELPYGDFQVVNTARLGEAKRVDLDANGTGSVEVPKGTYEYAYNIEGRPQVDGQIVATAPTHEVQSPAPVVTVVKKLTLVANPEPTGFLDPDTEIEITVKAWDANNNETSPENFDWLYLRLGTPPGKQIVKSLERTGNNTWKLTVGPDGGAVRLVPVYGPDADDPNVKPLVAGKPKLVSGLGAAASLPIIVIEDAEIEEGNSGSKDLVFKIHLDKISQQTVTVDFNAAWIGSAQPGQDYTDVSGKLTFKPKSLTPTTTLKVPIHGDFKAEEAETFAVGLSNPVNARLTLKNSAIGTIIDDDSASILITPTTDHETSESGGTATFTTKLASQPSENVTIQWATRLDADEGTVSPATYTFTPTNWSTAKTFTVTGVDDALIDGDRAYQVYVSSVTSTDPAYSGLDLSSLFVNYVNKDNDELGDWQIYITIGDDAGYVIDNQNPHKIDTRIGQALAYYPEFTWPAFNAYTNSNALAWLADWVNAETGELEGSGAALNLTDVNYPNGLALIVYINGAPLTAAYAATPEAGAQTESLAPEAAAALLAPAIESWASAGLGEAQLASLRSTPIEVADLPDRLLATYSGGKIWLDQNAAGFGWFIDLTPVSSEEFERASASSFRALETGPAADRMDLFTVLNHELGHALGLGDLDESLYMDDLMTATLVPGVRRTASSVAVDAVFANRSWL